MNTKQIILLTLALLNSTVVFSLVGIGTPIPHESAILEVKSTTKGFLPPRMTDGQRDAITSPPDGLIIFNTTVNCLQWYNGSVWYDGCGGSTSTIGIPGNNTCATATISVTPCSAVSGATINDDINTADGIEYDWSEATGVVAGGTTRALVEIGGQCWFRSNSITPSTYTGTGDFDGFYANASTEPAIGEGRIYQWNAAMNGSTTERAQGVCPEGWHVPSDCETMYLENTLGMSTADQQVDNAFRNCGSVGSKLSSLTSGGTNSSGFTALFAGYRATAGTFFARGTNAYFCSSTATNATEAPRRNLSIDHALIKLLAFLSAVSKTNQSYNTQVHLLLF